MGLHGFVGYLPQPRATQDVDVMVPYSQKSKAVRAIAARWPRLAVHEFSQTIRFLDPGDVDPATGTPQPVIDLMLPWGLFPQTILENHVIVDPETGHRIPTVEAAIVSKYAALVSPHRDRDKREYDAGDFRRLVKANQAALDRSSLRSWPPRSGKAAGKRLTRSAIWR